MLIYSDTDLYSKHVREQASEAFLEKRISDESYNNILTAYHSRLYTPNYFIRIALGVLTLVAIIFSGLLLALISSLSSMEGWMILFIVFGLIVYTALELLVKGKHYYNAGVDNLLMFFAATSIVSAFALNEYSNQNVVISGVTMLVCLYLAVRFSDGFMSMLSYVALFVFSFFLYTKFGTIAKATAPFLLMLVSAIVYVIMRKLADDENLSFYKYCCRCVIQLTLLTFYVSSNYFVVKELSNEMFKLNLAMNDLIPFGWVFWILTFIIPPAYVVYGIFKRDMMFIRTGLVLIAATVFTFRYYYAIVPAEIAMLIGGAVLIATTYALMQYLKKEKHGFSFIENKTAKKRINLEALVITQVAGQKTHTETNVEFGGGSFGSGGAGGSY